jgi:hypothetical protein
LGSQTSPDLYVLQLPLPNGESWLSAFVFIGGLSAATSMCDRRLHGAFRHDRQRAGDALPAASAGALGDGRRARHGARWWCFVRRAAVVLILMAGYAYERIISGYLPLASIGLISFCAVAISRLVWCLASIGSAPTATAWWRDWPAALSFGSMHCCCRPCTRAPAAARWAPLKPYLPAPLAELDPVGQGFVVGI